MIKSTIFQANWDQTNQTNPYDTIYLTTFNDKAVS